MIHLYGIYCLGCGERFWVNNGDPDADPYGFDVEGVKCPFCGEIVVFSNEDDARSPEDLDFETGYKTANEAASEG